MVYTQRDVNFTKEAKEKSVSFLLRGMPETNDNKKNNQGNWSGKRIPAGTAPVVGGIGLVGAGLYGASKYYYGAPSYNYGGSKYYHYSDKK